MSEKNIGITVIKKDGTCELFIPDKIKSAICRSASRALVSLSDTEQEDVVCKVLQTIKRKDLNEVPVALMHIIVEDALRQVSPKVADSYGRYRDSKKEFADMLDECFKKANDIQYGTQDVEDKNNNANANDTLVSTKRCLIFDEFNKKLYQSFFLNQAEREAIRDGYIYINDMSARRDTTNCCLFDLAEVLKGGFYSSAKGGMWYNEPSSLDTFFDVSADVIEMAASQQYGGFTVCEIDKIIEPYAQKTYDKFFKKEYEKLIKLDIDEDTAYTVADSEAVNTVKEQMKAGFQGYEYKFNTVASSRGDYPFITFTYGLATGRWGKLAAITCSNVRAGGQGRKGCKKPVLFPKLVFLYDENLHDEGCELEPVFEAAIDCSQKAMYPDFLSLTGDGTFGSVSYMYKKYGVVTSPMGCRAFLSPWFVNSKGEGSMTYSEEKGFVTPVTVGRFNIGVVSLHLPLIYQKSKTSGKNFWDLLDYYLEMIRDLHKRTYDYLGELRASCNPLAFCEGGFFGGHLKANDKIRPLLKSATASFGVTALNELQILYNGKSLREDQEFSNKVIDYILDKINGYKTEDEILYALYGTPAESLCGKQIIQFRKLFGIIPGVSDRPYVSNSFHLHVSEDITPSEKQDKEYTLFHKFTGGRIQYCRYPIDYNRTAIKSLVKRAMKMGLYEGINLALCTCEECGHKELEMKVCPVCQSRNISRIDRMNGYLQWTSCGNQDTENARKDLSKVDIDSLIATADRDAESDTRTSVHKLAEIADRKSM